MFTLVFLYILSIKIDGILHKRIKNLNVNTIVISRLSKNIPFL